MKKYISTIALFGTVAKFGDTIKKVHLVKVLEGLAQPANGGTTIEAVTKDGVVVSIKDTISGLWFPVSEFPKAKNSVGYMPKNKHLTRAQKEFNKAIAEEKASILAQWTMEGSLTDEQAKKALLALEKKEFNLQDAINKLEVKGTKEAPAGTQPFKPQAKGE